MAATAPMPAPPPGPAPHTRYFVMKALSFESMQQSVVSGSWSTQRHNQDKLNDAFAQGAVVFFFSVNMSGHFQGYAFMRSVVGPTTTCQVEWKVLTDLPFRDTESITNPMNEGKPVRISRDGQEVSAEAGQRLVALFGEYVAQQGNNLQSVRATLMASGMGRGMGPGAAGVMPGMMPGMMSGMMPGMGMTPEMAMMAGMMSGGMFPGMGPGFGGMPPDAMVGMPPPMGGMMRPLGMMGPPFGTGRGRGGPRWRDDELYGARGNGRYRPRSRSPRRWGPRPNLLDMTYDEYVALFKEVSEFRIREGQQQQQSMMSEAQYLDTCRAAAAANGGPFDEMVVKQYYAQMQALHDASVGH